MTDLEERLRRDLSRAADLPQEEPIRPLTVPQRTRSATVLRSLVRSSPRAGAVRWLAPVTAILVVAAIAVAAVLAGRPSQAPSGAAGMPEYYVTLGRGTPHAVTVTVRESVTGARVQSVLIREVPNGGFFARDWVTAGANDRVFAIGVQLHVWILRLTADGGVQQLKRLPQTLFTGKPMVTEWPGVLSPKGAEIAFGLSNPQGVAVVSLTSRAVRTWLTGHQGVEVLGSWQGDELSVDGRLLDVAGPGGSLLADSRPLRTPIAERGWELGPAVTTTDLTAFVGGEVRLAASSPVQTCRIAEFSARTGKVLRVLYTVSAPTRSVGEHPFLSCAVASLAPTGLNALVDAFGFGRLDGSHFTPVPGRVADFDQYGGQAAW